MNKQNVTKAFKDFRKAVSKRSPEILTGIGIAGMITTTVLAVKATPRALELIEEAEDYKFESGEGNALTKIETIKAAWKPYIPSMVLGVASTTCLVCANTVSSKRTAALATAYKLSETALTEYKEKVVETIGEKKAAVIKENIAKDKVAKDPVKSKEIIITGGGESLCYDAMSGRYFKSDIDRIKRAVNEVNRTLTYEMYVSLNEFYSEIGLRPTKQGDLLGWNLDDGLLDIDFSSTLSEDGTPCVVIEYNIAPRYDYSRLM